MHGCWWQHSEARDTPSPVTDASAASVALLSCPPGDPLGREEQSGKVQKRRTDGSATE